jgi:hypothetical protein
MRIASFNLENFFRRVKAMNFDSQADGKVILEQYARVNKLLSKSNYTATDKKNILDALDQLGLKKTDESKFAILRQNRAGLIKRPKNQPPEIVANGRDDFIGWVSSRRKRSTRSPRG